MGFDIGSSLEFKLYFESLKKVNFVFLISLFYKRWSIDIIMHNLLN